jgi:hypothetical protein
VIRGCKGIRPRRGARAFVDESARVIGDDERAGLREYAADYGGYKDTCRAEAEESR